MSGIRIILGPVLLLVAAIVSASVSNASPSALYLGNEGVMVSAGGLKILFDPLFKNDYGQYQLVSDEYRDAIFRGAPPFDNIDSVFVSHSHEDHFDNGDMLRLLRTQPEIILYAPEQAVRMIRAVAEPSDAHLFDRVVGFDLDYGDLPIVIQKGSIDIEAVHIPHAGWPESMTDLQNIAYRVTLGGSDTVLHLGDADPQNIHFDKHADYWHERQIDIAMPPFWFFLSAEGQGILENHLRAVHSIGIHMPARFSDKTDLPNELRDYDLFTRPGERREVDTGKTVNTID